MDNSSPYSSRDREGYLPDPFIKIREITKMEIIKVSVLHTFPFLGLLLLHRLALRCRQVLSPTFSIKVSDIPILSPSVTDEEEEEAESGGGDW